jgi:FtsH-binding integral membrane protein
MVTQFWLAVVAAVLALAISCALVCISGLARTVPTNYILLFTFTLLEAYGVAFMCAIVNDGMVVLGAAFMTAGITIALTLYAVFTKTDFTACGGVIAVIGGAFFIFSLISIFFGSTFRLVLACIGVIIFGLYLVFDTQYIVGGRHRKHTVSKEDYILGAMILYIDIIQIFMYLLEIFMNKDD